MNYRNPFNDPMRDKYPNLVPLPTFIPTPGLIIENGKVTVTPSPKGDDPTAHYGREYIEKIDPRLSLLLIT